MKHKHITYATRNNPGYTAPSAPASKKGGKFPHLQKFRKPASSKKGA